MVLSSVIWLLNSLIEAYDSTIEEFYEELNTITAGMCGNFLWHTTLHSLNTSNFNRCSLSNCTLSVIIIVSAN